LKVLEIRSLRMATPTALRARDASYSRGGNKVFIEYVVVETSNWIFD
jgi:hypothetical protein